MARSGVRVHQVVVGAEEAVAGINAMAPHVRDKVAAATLLNLREIRQTARSLVPYSGGRKAKGTRHLRDTIKERSTGDGTSGEVRAGGKGAMHANLVEGGVKAHAIKVPGKYATGQAKRVLSDPYRRVFGRSVKHPGHQAQPFMRPALDRQAPIYRRDVVKAAQEGIEA